MITALSKIFRQRGLPLRHPNRPRRAALSASSAAGGLGAPAPRHPLPADRCFVPSKAKPRRGTLGPNPAGLPARGIPVSPAQQLKGVWMRWTMAILVLVSVADIGLHAIDSVAAQKEELRDPFVFGPRDASDHRAALVLIGVLWDAAHPLAMVGDAIVGVGDQIGDWRVIKIQHDGILIEQGERRELITTGMAIPQD